MLKPTTTRYLLFTLHTILIFGLWLPTLFLLGEWALVIPQIVSCALWLGYCPAAIYISAMDLEDRFASGGMEIGYLVLQQSINLICGIFALILHATFDYCDPQKLDPLSPALLHYSPKHCNVLIVIATFQFVHFAVLLGWMIWVIHTARRIQKMSTTRALNKIPVQRLIQWRWDTLGMSDLEESGPVYRR